MEAARDGFLATFDGPPRSVRCPAAVSEAARSPGSHLRAGLHTRGCEVIGETLGGIAVHIGSRVSPPAAPDEGLVSRTGLCLQDRGVHGLRGVPADWRLLAVERLEG